MAKTFTKGLVAAIALTMGATPALAQNDSRVTGQVRFPIGKNFFQDAQVGVAYQNVDVSKGDKVLGGEAGIYWTPFNGNILTPALVEAKAIAGENDFHGKLGAGYNFDRKTFVVPAGVNYEGLELTVDVLSPSNATIGYGGNAFDKYDKKVVAPVAPPVVTPPGPVGPGGGSGG